MRSTILLLIALALMLAALPLLSWGTNEESTALWVAGLLILGAASLIPPALRFIDPAFDETPESDE